MERTLIFIGFVLVVSCSRSEEPKGNGDDRSLEKNQERISNVYCGNIDDAETHKNKLEATEVNWMYMDDSLKNLCRPLNFKLPLMRSDLTHLPEMAGIEIARLPVFRNFETHISAKGKINDTIFHYFVNMRSGNCKCKIIRFYQGDSTRKSFDGYAILEQVICNAIDKDSSTYDFKVFESSKKGEVNDTSYTPTGHDH